MTGRLAWSDPCGIDCGQVGWRRLRSCRHRRQVRTEGRLMAEGDTTFAEAGGVRLCVQTFGDPCDPAILLISGMSASIDWWDEDFCARLAAGLRYVIRYDHRDTGQSACYPPGAPSYTGGDLAADAVAVLDALRVDTAHLVGISMGGAIAQRLALE